MNSVHLNGAEDVQRAGNNIAAAAREMKEAASSISFALEQHQRFLDDWLARFRDVVEAATTVVVDKT